MNPTAILMQEHRVIEQVLNCLEKLLAETEQQPQLEAAVAQDLLTFFRGFADRCHHGKEEAQLFPVLETKPGFAFAYGPTHVMRAEHQAGRAYVRGMGDALELLAKDPTGSRQRFLRDGRCYLTLLREHIQKEDHCLFVHADEVLSADEQAAVLAAFETVEHEEMGAGTHEQLLALADRLAQRFGVPKAELGTGASTCCHHHRHPQPK